MSPTISRALLAFGLTASAAQADTYVVTRFDDPAVIACTPRDCSLRSAVIAANAHPGTDTIKLSSGQYDLTLAPYITVPGGALRITDSLTVQGLGSKYTTIRQHAHYRVFTVVSTQLAVSGVTILDGQSLVQQPPDSDGGCIFALDSNLKLADAIVANCRATYRGGAIYQSGGVVTLDGSVIELDHAGIGGGIAMDGSDPQLRLRNHARITRNTADFGGGIGAGAGLVDSDGAIVHPATVTMTSDSLVDANQATYAGGAAYVEVGLNVSLDPSEIGASGRLARIIGNSTAAGGSGGAFDSDGTLRLTRVQLESNRADRGGALAFACNITMPSCPAVYVDDSLLDANTADQDGGALWGQDGVAFVHDVALANNQALYRGGAIYYQTGGVHLPPSCEATAVFLTNASVSGNRASRGGGAALGNGAATSGTARLDARYATFLDNHSTGSPLANDVVVENVQISDGSGGLVWTANGLSTAASIYTGGCDQGLSPVLLSYGANFDTTAGSCAHGGAGDHTGTSLATLGLTYGYFGGPFALVALSPTSVAIDASTVSCPSTDARGALRNPAVCDSGAFEFGAGVP